mmetsp:Transcript_11967/g.24064  ORF Transcript_11967/g.24064 Transcript_11967/m.24064 type:complete len:711 (-) Transcript_11967:80-2212(-)
MEDQETTGSTQLFAVFLVSILSLFLLPYTGHLLFSGEDEDEKGVETWKLKKGAKAKTSSKKSSFQSRLRKLGSWKLLIVWTIYVLLIWYVKTSNVTVDRFDPFEILQIPQTATDAEIKRAYRKLSLVYHPDKNPDPEAANYFAEKVTKAYKALTDEAAKENFIKYGHPDGRQAVSISVALPEWFFNKDKEAAPAILLTLLFGGIVFPLGMAAWYMKRSKKNVGFDEVMPETQQLYMFGPSNIKQAQGVGKIAETLCLALEFINLCPNGKLGSQEGNALMNELRPEVFPYYPEVGDVEKSTFYKKRPPGTVIAQLLIYGHLCRQSIPKVLKKDFDFVMKKMPRLIQEFFTLASSVPRIKPNYGWASPSIGAVEFMQCMVRAVPTEAKKHFPAPGKSSQGPPSILQLPHITHEMCLKQLMKRKITSIMDFFKMDDDTIVSELANIGLNKKQIADIKLAIYSFPALTMSGRCFVDDEEEIESSGFLSMKDIVTIELKVFLSRRAHGDESFDAESIRGKTVRAYAPNYPFPKDEFWIFMAVNGKDNSILAHQRVSLVEAERNGALNRDAITKPEKPEDIVRAVNELGQTVRLQFLAPAPGKHNITIIAMCDSWIGADYAIALPLTAVEPTRAQKEGRAPRTTDKKKIVRSEESEDMIAEQKKEEQGTSDTEEIAPDEDADEKDSDDESDEWDSDEYGTEESGSDSETESHHDSS